MPSTQFQQKENEATQSNINHKQVPLDEIQKQQQKQQTHLEKQFKEEQSQQQHSVIKNQKQFKDNSQEERKPLKESHQGFDQCKEIIHKSVKPKLTFYESLLKNKFLRATFKHFCMLTYTNTKKTFDQMIKDSEMMSLSKWMILCKEFELSKIIQFDKKQTQIVNNQNINMSINQSKGTNDLSKVSRKNSEILVKQINRLQIKTANIYKRFNQNNSKMTYSTFVKAIQYIGQIYCQNFKKFSLKDEKIEDIQVIEDKFMSEILGINDQRTHKHKMADLKVQFKGSLSYYHETKLPQEKSSIKSLIPHGGRLPSQVECQLQKIIDNKKIQQKNWIQSQPQNISVYSKSRVGYKPEPKKNYQPNDVIRMARNQTQQKEQLTLRGLQQQKTRFIADRLSIKHKGQKESFDRNVQKNTFSSIFQDKTNTFAQKIDRMKNFYLHRESNLKLKQLQQNDDEILKMYFQNQKRIYGGQKGKKHAKSMTKSRVVASN